VTAVLKARRSWFSAVQDSPPPDRPLLPPPVKTQISLPSLPSPILSDKLFFSSASNSPYLSLSVLIRVVLFLGGRAFLESSCHQRRTQSLSPLSFLLMFGSRVGLFRIGSLSPVITSGKPSLCHPSVNSILIKSLQAPPSLH